MSLLAPFIASLLSTLATPTTPSMAPFAAIRASLDIDRLTHESVVWAGHEIIEGHKEVPVLGKLKTRTDTYSIARLRPDPSSAAGFIVEASACKVEFKKVAGTRVSMGVEHLPASRVTMRLNPDSGAGERSMKGQGTVRWGREDVDKDGHPGVAVQVDAPMCGGTVHVSNESRISMRSEDVSLEGMTGKVDVRVSQSVLEAEGRCLSRLAKDESSRSKGRFAYKRVLPSSTCASLMAKGWPVRAR